MSSLLYISIAYYMQKGGGEGVQIACKTAYIINGRPLGPTFQGTGVEDWSLITRRVCVWGGVRV